jgi:hypothetical protein
MLESILDLTGNGHHEHPVESSYKAHKTKLQYEVYYCMYVTLIQLLGTQASQQAACLVVGTHHLPPTHAFAHLAPSR